MKVRRRKRGRPRSRGLARPCRECAASRAIDHHGRCRVRWRSGGSIRRPRKLRSRAALGRAFHSLIEDRRRHALSRRTEASRHYLAQILIRRDHNGPRRSVRAFPRREGGERFGDGDTAALRRADLSLAKAVSIGLKSGSRVADTEALRPPPQWQCAPSSTMGAVTPVIPRAPTDVVVFRRPCGIIGRESQVQPAGCRPRCRRNTGQ